MSVHIIIKNNFKIPSNPIEEINISIIDGLGNTVIIKPQHCSGAINFRSELKITLSKQNNPKWPKQIYIAWKDLTTSNCSNCQIKGYRLIEPDPTKNDVSFSLQLNNMYRQRQVEDATVTIGDPPQ